MVVKERSLFYIKEQPIIRTELIKGAGTLVVKYFWLPRFMESVFFLISRSSDDLVLFADKKVEISIRGK